MKCSNLLCDNRIGTGRFKILEAAPDVEIFLCAPCVEKITDHVAKTRVEPRLTECPQCSAPMTSTDCAECGARWRRDADSWQRLDDFGINEASMHNCPACGEPLYVGKYGLAAHYWCKTGCKCVFRRGDDGAFIRAGSK